MKKALCTLIVRFIIVILVCAIAYALNDTVWGDANPYGWIDGGIYPPSPYKYPPDNLYAPYGIGASNDIYTGPPPSPPLKGYFGPSSTGLLSSPTNIIATGALFGTPLRVGSNITDYSRTGPLSQYSYNTLTGVGLSNVLLQFDLTTASTDRYPYLASGLLGSSMVNRSFFSDSILTNRAVMQGASYMDYFADVFSPSSYREPFSWSMVIPSSLQFAVIQGMPMIIYSKQGEPTMHPQSEGIYGPSVPGFPKIWSDMPPHLVRGQ